MGPNFGKWIGIAVMVAVLCLAGLVMSGEARAERFVDNGNGTVTDTKTKLMWTKSASPFGMMNWYDATSRCSSSSIAGLSGWRLPTKDELLGLYRAGLSGKPFTDAGGFTYYWSSTTSGYEYYAWGVSMQNGTTLDEYKGNTLSVWPVRRAQ